MMYNFLTKEPTLICLYQVNLLLSNYDAFST